MVICQGRKRLLTAAVYYGRNTRVSFSGKHRTIAHDRDSKPISLVQESKNLVVSPAEILRHGALGNSIAEHWRLKYKASFKSEYSSAFPGSRRRQGQQNTSPEHTFPWAAASDRYHFGHSHHHDHHEDSEVRNLDLKPGHEREEAQASGERISKVGLVADLVLTGAKGAAGWLSGSSAMLADAAHSVSDVALSAFAWWSFKAASAPRDAQHPYGHGKFESIGALGVSALLLVTGVGMTFHSLHTLQEALMPAASMLHDSAAASASSLSLPPSIDSSVAHATVAVEKAHGSGGIFSFFYHHDHRHPNEGLGAASASLPHLPVALAAVLLSIGVKEGLFRATMAVGNRLHSPLLRANAWHHRSDAVSSLVALVGVGGAMAGLPLLDPVAGLLVSGMIIKAGVATGTQSLEELVDSSAPPSLLHRISDTLAASPGVLGCHKLRGRKMGPFLHIDGHIEVDPCLSVQEGHDIGEAAKRAVRQMHPNVAEILLHIDPAPRCTS